MCRSNAEEATMTAEPIETLRQLAAELEQRRFSTRLCVREGRPPYLTVVNPQAPVLSDDVLTAPDDKGVLWYWFPWRAPIGPVDGVIAAADRVEKVLAEVGRPTV